MNKMWIYHDSTSPLLVYMPYIVEKRPVDKLQKRALKAAAAAANLSGHDG